MILDAARKALATGPLCDPCLGRPFADRSFGLTNDQRGRALRTTVTLAEDEPFEPGEESDCWVCEGQCSRYDLWAERAAEALAEVDFSTYQVGTRAPPLIEENDALLRAEAGLPEDAGELFKSECNREVGKRLGARTGTEVDFERPDVLCMLDIQRETVEVQVNPAFLYGRYRKLERDIPQTEWPCSACGSTGKELAPDGGERNCRGCGGSGYRYDDSVEGLTAPIVREAMDGSEGVFHGAGREDVDAKMLGTGRPFVLEVKHPRVRDIDPEAIESAIEESTDLIEVEGLRRATHTMVERVKELEASKTYVLTVRFAEPVSQSNLEEVCEALLGETISQRTPNRVDHRRADIVRTREVYAIEGTLEADPAADAESNASEGTTGSLREGRRATIEVHGAGGLYVKELAHGDEGRTEPSLAGLLSVDIEIEALDVLAVEGEDEPFERSEFFLD
ncbi:tRNA pseudouridine(54/55) synthase Pus10 [Halobacteriales archaeon QS_3_64_16]|nr:MAG: tRNA pseudouridine(54/55) synthase Pus10 [Halobacteriales archaeon QS_3_64_16]